MVDDTPSQNQNDQQDGARRTAASGAEQSAPNSEAAIGQLTDGAKQMAAGVKGLYDSHVTPRLERSGVSDFVTDRVAPAARTAAGKTRDFAQEQREDPRGALCTWITRAPRILPVAAIAGILTLFLPIASMMGHSVNLFSDPFEGEGQMLLVLLLIVMALAVAALVRPSRILRILASLGGIGMGLLLGLDGLVNLIRAAGESGITLGIGLPILILVGAALMAAGTLNLFGLRSTSPNTTTTEQP